jgi:hypothetical protein
MPAWIGVLATTDLLLFHRVSTVRTDARSDGCEVLHQSCGRSLFLCFDLSLCRELAQRTLRITFTDAWNGAWLSHAVVQHTRLAPAFAWSWLARSTKDAVVVNAPISFHGQHP